MISFRQADLLQTIKQPMPAFYVHDEVKKHVMYDPKTNSITYDAQTLELDPKTEVFRRPEGYIINTVHNQNLNHKQKVWTGYTFKGYFWGVDKDGNIILSRSDWQLTDPQIYDTIKYFMDSDHEQGLHLQART